MFIFPGSSAVEQSTVRGSSLSKGNDVNEVNSVKPFGAIPSQALIHIKEGVETISQESTLRANGLEAPRF